MQTIYLDISNKGVVPTIYAKQGDVGRKVQVIFTDSGIPYEIPENAELSVWYDGDSGDGNYTDIGDKSAIVVENNKVTFELITQMLNNDGEGIVCLIMNVGEEQIGSWNIHYLCEKVPGFDSEGASSYFTAFSESVNKLKNTDKTLTKEGYPADAKATGDKIDSLSAADVGAAPAGYGLGETSKNSADINTEKVNGYFRTTTQTENFNYAHGMGHVRSYNADEVVQNIFRAESGTERVRYTRDGGETWIEETVNPYMSLGEEYRITERWNGKPVYAKLIDIGKLPASSASTFTASGLDAESVVYAKGTMSNGRAFPYETNSATFGSVRLLANAPTSAGSVGIRVETTSDLSAYNGYVTLKYTKKS